MRLRFTSGEGFQLKGHTFSLDAGRVQPVGIVSHAHGDHAARHKKIICTPETALLLALRWKQFNVRAVPFEQTIALEGARITLHPSGHILGSAMTLVEVAGLRILYTGDLRTDDGPLFPGARPIACDILVIESTFGRPEYRFPPMARVKQMLHAFVDAARASSYTPVLTGYALGKAQELVSILGEYRETIWTHPKIAATCDVYRRAGMKLPDVEVPSAGAPPGALVVMPPNFSRLDWRARVQKPRVCFCSGWANDRRAGRWWQCDQAIPLSDHPDCEGLVKFAQATGAKIVYTNHGFASELAEQLRALGLTALPLPEQWHDPEEQTVPQYTSETLDLFNS